MYGVDGDKVYRRCRLLHLLLSSLSQTAINFLCNGPYYHPHCTKCNLKYLLYLSILSCFEELLVHSTVKSEHSEQSSSSPGTQSINRKYSLSHSVLFHSPPSPYHSITHPLSGSGFVSGLSVCVCVCGIIDTDYQNRHSSSRVRTCWMVLTTSKDCLTLGLGPRRGLVGIVRAKISSWGMNYVYAGTLENKMHPQHLTLE